MPIGHPLENSVPYFLYGNEHSKYGVLSQPLREIQKSCNLQNSLQGMGMCWLSVIKSPFIIGSQVGMGVGVTPRLQYQCDITSFFFFFSGQVRTRVFMSVCYYILFSFSSMDPRFYITVTAHPFFICCVIFDSEVLTWYLQWLRFTWVHSWPGKKKRRKSRLGFQIT